MKKAFTMFAALLLVLALTVPAMAEDYVRPTMTAYKMANVVIDGSLDEWNLESPAVIDDIAQVTRDIEIYHGADDCSVRFYMGWDGENLYLAADVTEDTPLGAIEMLPIDGEDNLKLFICTDPTAELGRQTLGTNDFIVYFVMDKPYWDTAIDRSNVEKDLRERFVSVGMDGGENVLDGYQCAVTMTTTGFIWEAVIPWSCFSNKKIAVYEPKTGDVLAVDFQITDIDYPCPGTQYIPQLTWSGSAYSAYTPYYWGAVTLAD